MKSHRLNFAALALCLSFGVAAHAQTMSEADFRIAREKIEADYKTASVPCASLSGNSKKICVVEAKGNKNVALTNLDAST